MAGERFVDWIPVTVLGAFIAGAAGDVPGQEAPGQDATGAALIYGRVTTDDGRSYEGRLRFGGDEEASWNHYFNGVRHENPWAARVPPGQWPDVAPLEVFGIELPFVRSRRIPERPFMARFGDLTRIDALGRELSVTLKSGTVAELDRYAADDFADGVRIWDPVRGIVDLDEWDVRSIEFLPGPVLEPVPGLLHGTVRTALGDFSGLIQWNRQQGLVSDLLDAGMADGRLNLPFGMIDSIERRPGDSASVMLADGREIVLAGSHEIGSGSRGIYVDDRRYGRVLISWAAFERVDFEPDGAGPSYAEFASGAPLNGAVVTRDGRRLSGRLVYDLDESESTETLDAPRQGIDYTIPFGLVASIELANVESRAIPHALVLLHGGETLELELSGDLGAANAGMLVFPDGGADPEYLAWAEVARVELERPPAMYPPTATAR